MNFYDLYNKCVQDIKDLKKSCNDALKAEAKNDVQNFKNTVIGKYAVVEVKYKGDITPHLTFVDFTNPKLKYAYDLEKK